MTTRIYIDWENGEVHTSLEEVVNNMSSYQDDLSFNFYLDENYTSEAIFEMTNKAKAEARDEYRAWVENEVKERIRELEWTVLEVNTDLDVKTIQ